MIRRYPQLFFFLFYKEALEALKARNEAAGGRRAQGGIITAPSLVGEAGPELVLPLDYSRAGRTNQIIQNFNTSQSFNMASNQQTPLAFSQAVGHTRKIDICCEDIVETGISADFFDEILYCADFNSDTGLGDMHVESVASGNSEVGNNRFIKRVNGL